jgi:hypothetical protein
MIEEPFDDGERQRLLRLAMAAVPVEHGDDALTNIIAKLSGVDTVLIARRAYPAPQVETHAPGKMAALDDEEPRDAGG